MHRYKKITHSLNKLEFIVCITGTGSRILLRYEMRSMDNFCSFLRILLVSELFNTAVENYVALENCKGEKYFNILI